MTALDLDAKERIARRVAVLLEDGDIVNLGIGIPTMVANFIPPTVNVHFHTENGMLDFGPSPSADQVDVNLVNAGKLPISEVPGCSYFDSAQSFAMIRGGHVSVAVLGTLQVDAFGRIANWAVPGQALLGVGGAMDLLNGARKVIAAMTHTTSKGEAKILTQCTLPLTGERSVDYVVTELAVFAVRNRQLILEEIAPGTTFEQVRQKTRAPFTYQDSSTISKLGRVNGEVRQWQG